MIFKDSKGDGTNMKITMVIDPAKNKVFYTYSDPVNKYTLTQQFTETEITVKK
jgi:hypothetical protein